jgi:tRNA wybutosine-synthesizing protein 1
MLHRQKYHLVGGHSATKRCRWLYESIVHDRPCYKQKFYGIRSHRCLQMTPSVLHCTMRCRFCWRAQSGDHELHWEENRFPTWDDPEDIIEGCIREQKRILSGYKANTQADRKKYYEALKPKHAAISLTGEPTLYPYLDGLIKGFHKRGFTTFLVSNGTNPETLSSLSEEPTQLYISVSAYNKETFHRVCRPHIQDAWKKLRETLVMLPSFKCPTVVRLTLARHLNLKCPTQYARIMKRANPTYIEPKAYMHVGFSRLRMKYNNMPTHKEIKDFAEELAEETGYNILDEAPESRVVLLSRLEKPIKHA